MPRRITALLLVLLFAFLSGCSSAPDGVAATGFVTPTPAPSETSAPIVSPVPTPTITPAPSPDPQAFAVTSAGFVNGVIQDAFGERAGQTLA